MMSPLPVAGLVLFFALLVRGDRLNLDGSVFIHMFEWKWKDIARECEEFLHNHGYSVVVISPPSENIMLPYRPWYERYQPISYKLHTRSGSPEELRDMVRRCNDVNVRVVADAVLNHMAAANKDCKGTGGSTCNSNDFKYEAAGLYYDDFHHFGGINDYQNEFQVRNHELEGLHDIDQSRPHVRDIQAKYMNELVDLGIAGFRMDAAKHMYPNDMKAILDQLHDLNTDHKFPPNTKPFIYSEVIDNGHEPIKFTDYTHLGKVTDFRFGNQLGMHFRRMDGRKLSNLVGFCWPPHWNMLPKEVGMVFVDNHDTQHDRFSPNHIDFRTSDLYKMSVAFMLAYNWGIPILMSSYRFDHREEGPPADQHGNIKSPVIEGMYCDKGQQKGWVCEQRWRQIYNMVEFYHVAKGSNVWEWWDNGNNAIGFCRLGKGYLAISLESYDVVAKVKTSLPEGTYCDVINGELRDDGTCSGPEVHVDRESMANIKIPKAVPNEVDSMLAFHLQSKKGLTRNRAQPARHQQNIPPPQSNQNTVSVQNQHNVYEQGEMFESGISNGGENVEITLKIKLSRDWLASLLRKTANTHGKY